MPDNSPNYIVDLTSVCFYVVYEGTIRGIDTADKKPLINPYGEKTGNIMPRLKRFKTDYTGVYYIVGKPLKSAEKPERIYYVRYRRHGKEIEEKTGREIRDRMTPEKSAAIRSELISGRRLSRKEIREQKRSVMLHLSQKTYNALLEEENRSGRDISEITDRVLLFLYADEDTSHPKPDGRKMEWDKIRSQLEELKEKQTGERAIYNQQMVHAIGGQTQIKDPVLKDENKYREILEHSFDVIYRLNLITGKFEYVSPASNKDWLMSPEDLLSGIDQKTLLSEHVHPDDIENVGEHMNNAVSKGRASHGQIIEFRARIGKGGKYGWFSNTHTIVFDNDNNPVALVGNARDVSERKKAEQKTLELIDHLESKAKDYADSLEETNAALRILLKQNRKEKEELETRVLSNIKEMVLPVVEKIKQSRPDKIQKLTGILETNLDHITSTFSSKVTSKHIALTHQELQVANYVINGKTTKEIAELLGRSERTIDFHRSRIRKKMGLVNTKENLRTHLLTLQ